MHLNALEQNLLNMCFSSIRPYCTFDDIRFMQILYISHEYICCVMLARCPAHGAHIFRGVGALTDNEHNDRVVFGVNSETPKESGVIGPHG